jgi:hypothetical protein
VDPTDPTSEELLACRSVMLELSICFGAFWDKCVLIGGWVPYLVLESKGGLGSDNPHRGSLDIDLLINVELVGGTGYTATVQEMERRCYDQGRDTFEWKRTVGPPVVGRRREVLVHLMAPESPRDPDMPHRRVPGGLQACVADCADVAFGHTFLHRLEGRLPTGEQYGADIRVADEVACFAMKVNMMPRPSFKKKDAYDLYMLIRYYPGGPEEMARRLLDCRGIPAVGRAIQRAPELFAAPTSLGSQWAVDELRGDAAASASDIDVLRNEVQSVFGELLTRLGSV